MSAVQALTTYTERARDIRLWSEQFGRRSRADITAADIRAVRDHWLTAPRSARDPRPVSGATINKRLRALSNLYAVLDGQHAPNPVRDVPELDEPRGQIRALDYVTIERILNTMPNLSRADKGKERPEGSRAKATARVLAYTGWPSGVLAKMTRERVDFRRQVAHLPARRKGRGADAVTVPLVAAAVQALKAYDRLGLWGPFDGRAVNRSWKRAAARCGVVDVRLYDLRHSFLTAVGQASRDERAVQALAQHGDARTTRRYTEGSVKARMFDAVTAVAGALQVPDRSAKP